jgi:hypothetical protein
MVLKVTVVTRKPPVGKGPTKRNRLLLPPSSASKVRSDDKMSSLTQSLLTGVRS